MIMLNMDKPEATNSIILKIYNTRTGTIGEEISSTNRGNKYNSFDHGRIDSRAQAFKDAYNSKKGGSGGRICG